MRRGIRAYPSVKNRLVAFSVGFIDEENVALISGIAYTYLLTSSAFSDGFSAVNGPVAPMSSQVMYTETWVFAGISTSGSSGEAISGRISIS